MNIELLQKHLIQWARASRIASQNAILPTCREFDLTYQQFTILTELSRTEGLSAGELSDRACILRSNFAAVARKLEKRGLLQQKKSQEDRRYSLLQLTPEGEQLVHKMFTWMEQRYGHVFLELSDETGEALARGTEAAEQIALQIEKVNLSQDQEAEVLL